MRLSLRIFLGYFALVGLAGWFYLQAFVDELNPGMRQTVEEVLVEVANLLAERVGDRLAADGIDAEGLAAEMERFAGRRFDAEIWGLRKREPTLLVYITDRAGIVRYHSEGRDLGADYSRWNDVWLTLRGRYGARSTRSDPNDPRSSTMYVAAPIRDAEGRTIGALTVGKPSVTVMPFVEAAERNLREQGLWLLLLALGLGLLLTYWLTRSIRRLTQYAEAVRAHRRVEVPRIAERELATLAAAMESMRVELEGKAYVENYLHTLTHELKSPLTAIRGAAELLDEEMPLGHRRRFLTNIRNESGRLQQIVERLLDLAALEKRQGLEETTRIAVDPLLTGLAEAKRTTAAARGVGIELRLNATPEVTGEPFLLQQAVSNLLDNAIEFSPEGGVVQVESTTGQGWWHLAIHDQGPGIPDYALGRIFERFYSQPRPATGRKGSGLGLSLVAEVVTLHRGRIEIANDPSGGTVAILSLPTSER